MIKSDDECYNNFGHEFDNLTMICTFAPKSGPCLGDSGGPLICNGKLTGLVSYVRRNGCASYPSVFTKIHFYKDWIEGILDQEEPMTTEKPTTSENQKPPNSASFFKCDLNLLLGILHLCILVVLSLYIFSKRHNFMPFLFNQNSNESEKWAVRCARRSPVLKNI